MPQIEVLTPADIEYAKSVSKTGNKGWGPWKDRYEEMARKTAVRRLAKYLPLSPELAFRFFTYWNTMAQRRTQRPDVRPPIYHLQSESGQHP